MKKPLIAFLSFIVGFVLCQILVLSDIMPSRYHFFQASIPTETIIMPANGEIKSEKGERKALLRLNNWTGEAQEFKESTYGIAGIGFISTHEWSPLCLPKDTLHIPSRK